MAISGKLGELFVDFVAKNSDQFKAAIHDTGEEFKKTDKAATEAGRGLKDRFGAATSAVNTIVGELRNGLALATGTVMGFVTAGLSTSAMGEQLSFQMGELSRTIAGVFAPEIQAVIDWVRDLTEWIRNLSDEQRDQIAHWFKVAAAIGAFLVIVPPIISAIGAVAMAVYALVQALVTLQAFSGPVGWAALAVGAVAAGAAIIGVKSAIDATKQAFAGFPLPDFSKGGDRHALTRRVGGFEAVEAAHARISRAAVTATMGRSSKPVAEQQLDVAHEQLHEQQKTNQKLDGMKPPFKN